MRTIKFRIWDKQLCKMTSPEDTTFKLTFDGHILDDSDNYPDGEYEIMQFTGLYDEDEKGLYDGDIIEREIEADEHNKKTFGIKKNFITTALIEWEEDNMMFNEIFEPHKKWRPCYQVLRLADAGFKIIGNKFENPELLSKSSQPKI